MRIAALLPRSIKKKLLAKMFPYRALIVRDISVHDGTFEYSFRCKTPAEVWRATTLVSKEPGTVRWIADNVHEGDVFYDIGANVGLYTLMAAKRVGKSGQVYAFEPHVSNFESLMRNIKSNSVQNSVTAFSSALHEHSGYFDFFYYDEEAGSSQSQLDSQSDDQGNEFAPRYLEKKYAVTVDELIANGVIRPAHHIKIDVDGNEIKILNGMTRTLLSLQAPRTVQIEINPQRSDDIEQFMQRHGYTRKQRHDTSFGQIRINAGQDAQTVSHNAIFEKM